MTLVSNARPRKGDRTLRVELVSMPFGALERPSLGLGLLQAGTQRQGHICTSHYFGFLYAESVGLEDYIWVCNELPYTAFVGEWLFARDLYGPNTASDKGYIDSVLRETWQLSNIDVARLLRMREWVEPFLERCLESVPWHEVDVVGFTSTFQQNVASLMLARRLALRFPHLCIVFGGANWEGPMGVELHRQFPFVDFACSGEADNSFPALLNAIATDDVALVPGIVYRASDGSTKATGSAKQIGNLDELPQPNYEDFLRAFESCPVVTDLSPVILMETSRGCWWGAHSHCTFCGLNGSAMAYRSKSPDRAFDELKFLVDQFGNCRVGFVDNILDMRYFKTFLPRVARELPGLSMFYEVKSSLTNRQIEMLAKAGVDEIQPGVESLSDHVLDLVRKGTSMLRNVQLLKWCLEHNVRVDWNILYGAPGENEADYDEMIPVIEAIGHLEPPTACGPIRLDRFSPYHDNPENFGITNVRPMAPYQWLYPVDSGALSRIAYYFEFSQPSDKKSDRHITSVRTAIEIWRTRQRGQLQQIVSDEDHVVLIDTRERELHRHDLVGWQASVYLTCDRTTSAKDLLLLMNNVDAPAKSLAEFVNWCVVNRLMLVRDRECLSLAVRTPARQNEFEIRSHSERRLALLIVDSA